MPTRRFLHAAVRLLLLGGAAMARPGAAVAQDAWNAELLCHPTSAGGRYYAACWGYTAPDGTELAMIGTVAGTEIYDVTDPRQPDKVGDIPGPRSQWREMQTWSHYAYVVTEGPPVGGIGGVQIVDLVDPRHPTHVGNFDSTFTTAHTIHIADGYAYVNGTDNGWRILDLADPEHPHDVGGWNVRYVHDCYVRGDLAYLCNITADGFTVMDISDRAHPRELAYKTYEGASTHNAWGTRDGKYLLTTDEVSGGHLRVWDVENPSQPVQVGQWISNPRNSIHNVVVQGDTAYIAYYSEGLRVLDITNPRTPVLVAYYDTYPGDGGLFDGNWGVYPLAKSGNIYLSDITSGLYVVRVAAGNEPPVLDFQLRAPQGQLALPGQDTVMFFFDLYNGAPGGRTFALQASTSAGWAAQVQPSIAVPTSGVEPVLVTVSVPAALASPMRSDVELCARSLATGRTLCDSTRVAVPVLLQGFEAEAHGYGVELRWSLSRDAADAGALVVLRAGAAERRSDGDAAFERRARLPLEATAWRDPDVAPGETYVYRLALDDLSGMHVLGEREVAVHSPSRSRVLGNVPNPFNPTTSIRFELARSGGTEVAVFDARGRLVRKLDPGTLAPGPHAVVWDGRDASGRPLPSGMYLYEVRSLGWTARGRMTLAK